MNPITVTTAARRAFPSCTPNQNSAVYAVHWLHSTITRTLSVTPNITNPTPRNQPTRSRGQPARATPRVVTLPRRT